MELALPVIVLFLLGMTGIGVWHARKVRSAEDFALAGRRIGAPVLAGTLTATWIGTGSLFGNSEFTYDTGVAGFFLPISGIVGMLPAGLPGTADPRTAGIERPSDSRPPFRPRRSGLERGLGDSGLSGHRFPISTGLVPRLQRESSPGRTRPCCASALPPSSFFIPPLPV